MRQIALLLIPSARRSRSPSPRRSCGSSTSAGSSTPSRRAQVAEALFWFSFSLPFAGINLLLTRTFFSLQRPWLPTGLALVALGAQRRACRSRSTGAMGIGGVVLGTAVVERDDDGAAGRCSCGASSDGLEVARTLRAAAVDAGRRGAARRSWRAACGRGSTRCSGRSLPAQLVSVGAALLAGGAAYAAADAALGPARGGRDPARCSRGRLAPRRPRLVTLEAPPWPPQVPHPQLLHHRPHRPRQVDAGRPHPGDDAHGRGARHAGPAARLHGPRARARHHHQGAGRARLLHGARRGDLPAAPDRHAGARGLHLRGVALPGRVRGRAAGGRRLAGRRGADRGQHLPGHRRRAGADPLPEQDRPARAPSPSASRRRSPS